MHIQILEILILWISFAYYNLNISVVVYNKEDLRNLLTDSDCSTICFTDLIEVPTYLVNSQSDF